MCHHSLGPQRVSWAVHVPLQKVPRWMVRFCLGERRRQNCLRLDISQRKLPHPEVAPMFRERQEVRVCRVERGGAAKRVVRGVLAVKERAYQPAAKGRRGSMMCGGMASGRQGVGAKWGCDWEA